MREELERAREESDGAQVYLLAAYYFITGNYSFVVILAGLGMIAFGGLILSGELAVGPLQAITHDVFAGMFGVWGATLVVIGVSAYAVLFANKMYARVSTDEEEAEESESGTETEFDANI